MLARKQSEARGNKVFNCLTSSFETYSGSWIERKSKALTSLSILANVGVKLFGLYLDEVSSWRPTFLTQLLTMLVRAFPEHEKPC